MIEHMQDRRRLRDGLVTAVLAVVIAAGTVAFPGAVNAATGGATPAWQLRMLARVNAVRAAAGVPAVALCAPLGSSADKYAHLMGSQDYFGHRGPDGLDPWDRMRAEGYQLHGAAENIAAGQRGVAAVMSSWRQSPAHYVNLVNPVFTHVGFGYARNRSSTYTRYWVQEFGFGGHCTGV